MSNPVNGTFKTSDGCAISYTLHPGPGANAPRVALVHSLALDRSIWDGVNSPRMPRCSLTTAAAMAGRTAPT